jgi:hypothetical protein
MGRANRHPAGTGARGGVPTAAPADGSVTFAELLSDVIGRLDLAGVPYMVTGSLASSYHGEPRATRDADIVIDPTPQSLTRLVQSLVEGNYYVDADAADEALRTRPQFNAVADDATKIDFIVRKDRAFSIEEFRRRQRADLLGTIGFVATAEDLVIAKLEWAAASDSERQLRDAAGIVAVAHGLDETYIDRWAAILGVTDAWRAIRQDRAP